MADRDGVNPRPAEVWITLLVEVSPVNLDLSSSIGTVATPAPTSPAETTSAAPFEAGYLPGSLPSGAWRSSPT